MTGSGETFCVYLYCTAARESLVMTSVAPLCEVHNQVFDQHCWLTMTCETAPGQVVALVCVYIFVQEKTRNFGHIGTEKKALW